MLCLQDATLEDEQTIVYTYTNNDFFGLKTFQNCVNALPVQKIGEFLVIVNGKEKEIPANHTAPPAGLVSNYKALNGGGC